MTCGQKFCAATENSMMPVQALDSSEGASMSKGQPSESSKQMAQASISKSPDTSQSCGVMTNFQLCSQRLLGGVPVTVPAQVFGGSEEIHSGSPSMLPVVVFFESSVVRSCVGAS